MLENFKRYDIFEHTADTGILVYGKTLRQLFANGGFALFDFMLDLSNVKKKVSKYIRLDCYDREELFVRWLQELLYLFEAEHLIFKYFDVQFVRGGILKVLVCGDKYNPKEHELLNQVKGVTYHQLKIFKEKDLWTARIILDL